MANRKSLDNFLKNTYKTLEETHKYRSVKHVDGKYTATSSVLLSGSDTYWSDSDTNSKRQNHSMIYVPGLRLAGTAADIRNFIASFNNEKDKTKIRSKDLDKMIANAFTKANHDSSADQVLFSWEENEDGSFSPKAHKKTRSFKHNYDAEIEAIKEARPSSAEKKSKSDKSRIRLGDLEQLILLLSKKKAEPKVKSAPKSRGKAKGTVTRDRKYFEGKIEKLGEGKYFNVNATDEAGNKVASKSLPTADGPAQTYTRFLAKSGKLSHFGFTYKGTADKAHLKGVINFLVIYEGITKEQAKEKVNAMIESSPASGKKKPAAKKNTNKTPASPKPASSGKKRGRPPKKVATPPAAVASDKDSSSESSSSSSSSSSDENSST